MQHQIATAFLQLCAVSSPPLPSGLTAIGEFASDTKARQGPAGREDPLLVGQLLELGAVPPLLRMHSLTYPRPLREGARRVLRPLLRLEGDAVRTAADCINIPQPVGTSPADWIAWRQQYEQDLYGDLTEVSV